MPGLLLLLSVGAVLAMAGAGVFGKSPSPNDPKVPPPGGGDRPDGPSPEYFEARKALEAAHSNIAPFSYGGVNYLAYYQTSPSGSYTTVQWMPDISKGPVASQAQKRIVMNPGEKWLMIVGVLPSPGVTIDRRTLENGLKSEISAIAKNTVVNWVGNDAQIAFDVIKTFEISLPKPPIVMPDATLILKSLNKVPGVV